MGTTMREQGSALIGILVSLLILVGLAVMGVLAFSAGDTRVHATSGSTADRSSIDAARAAVNRTELTQVQAAADDYAAVTGSVPDGVTALVAGGELRRAPHCALVIDPATGTVAYGPAQADPTCHP